MPAAVDDSDLGNAIGDTVDVGVLGNDTGSFDVVDARLRRCDSDRGTTLSSPGEGTWSVLPGGVDPLRAGARLPGRPDPGAATTSPTSPATPVDALVTITYVPAAADDSDLGNAFGTT